MTSNGYISFNSKDSFNGQYQNFNLNTRNISAWGVEKSQFINRTPNITPYNNKLAVTNGSQSFPVIIPIGQYDLETFAQELEIELNLQSFSGFTISVNPDGSIVVLNATPFNFVEINEVSKDLATMAGWPLKSVNDPLISELLGYPDLIYSSYVDITSSDLNQTNKSDDYASNNTTRNIIDRIHLTEYTVPSITINQNNNVKMMTVNGELFVGNLNIQIKDEFGNNYYNPDNLTHYNVLLITK